MYIAEIIVRCSIEIEAISKELYYVNGGNMEPVNSSGKPRNIYFDTDCLNFLDQKWNLSKKQITVSAVNFHFSNENYKIITPLHKSHIHGTNGSEWKQAYQAIKHDRSNSIKKANIENMINALGALYILNLY